MMIYTLVILSMLFLMPLTVYARDENVLNIESWGNGAPELSVSVPLGYTIEKHRGPDFNVHYIKSKNTNDPSMGIYIGHHPNSFSSQRRITETTKEEDLILSQKAEWVSWQEKQDGKTIYHVETIIGDVFKGMGGSGVAGLKMHLFVKGSDQKQVNFLKASAKSLRIINK